MKQKSAILAASAALLLATLTTGHAFDDFVFPEEGQFVDSPDGKFRVTRGKNLEVIAVSPWTQATTYKHPNGETVLVIDDDSGGDADLTVAWSHDSSRVVITKNLGRGGSVYAAWHDGSTWHKTLEPDQDQAGLIQAAQARGLGRLVSESRKPTGWPSADAVTLHADLVFSSGKHVACAYTLHFVQGPTHLDRGGFEEGAIRGSDYRLEQK